MILGFICPSPEPRALAADSARINRLKQKPRPGGPGRGVSPKSFRFDLVFALRAGQHQQRLEEVDEVEIEAKRAIDRLLLRRLIAVAGVVALLDRLRIPGGKA